MVRSACERENFALESKERTDSDILVAGHAVIDQVIDSPGQGSARQAQGGPPSYASVALSSLGFRSAIITKVGEDFPREYSVFLRQYGGINIEKFRVIGEKTTSFRIDRSVEPRRMWLLGRCRALSSHDFFAPPSESQTSRPRGLLVNTVAGEISLPLLDRISKEFDVVFVDSQGFVRRVSKDNEVQLRSGLDISALSGVDFLKADRREISAWTGLSDFDASLRQIARFVRYVIVTSGPGFAEVYEGQRIRWRTKPLEVRISDTTGAGDIFLAVFAACFVRSENVPDALAVSCCAASLALERKGVEKAILDKQMIDAKTHAVQILSF
jgi:sugar/nucleoside kinase (ribokinase family)